MSRDLDGDELVAVEPELAGASTSRPSDGAIEVRIGDLAVIHTPADSRRRRQKTAYAAIVGVAAAIALVVAVFSQLMSSGGDGNDKLAVTASRPSTPAKPAAAQPTVPTATRPHVKTSAPANAAVVPPPAPPAPLSVTTSLSDTTVQAGSSITVNYSWTDGSGHLLYLNHVGVTASKVVRLPPCGAASSVPKASKGSGSWTFSLPLGLPSLIDGVSFPFDHPERVKVGVQIGTGGKCGAVEAKTVTQWVTLYPAGT